MTTRMHRFTLSFTDAETERAYRDAEFPRMRSQGRFAAFLGLASYLALGILDPWLFAPEVQPTIWAIRLATMLVAIATISLSFFPIFRRANYFLLALIGPYAGIGFIAFSLYLPPEQASFYYPGMILVCFFTYNFIGTRFVYAFGVDMLLLFSYNLVAILRGDFPMMQLAVDDVFIVISNLLGGAAGYLNEVQRRRLFLSELVLREEMENAKAARREAEFANTAKSRFLAAVSHDLRQPIHAQGLLLNVLANTDLDDQQRKAVASLNASTAASSEMLHTLMDFSRIEAGAITPEIRAFHLQPLLNKIENECMPLADAKNLAYRSRETALVVRSDPAMLEMILRNLVSNAIRYTYRGGILLACRKRGDMAVIEVRDSGIGIEASQHREIFREFHQLGNPERDRRKGLGLGLSIVDGLARILGHPLSLNSAPGRGSVFRLALPIANAADIQPEAAETRIMPRTSCIRILLIDDDETVRLGTQQQLSTWGFECNAVEFIEAAQSIAREYPPNMVISDYRLRENRTGAEAIIALREQLGNPHLPALLITGDTSPERINEARSYGIPLLHKPVEPSKLYRAIVEALEQT